MKKNTRSLAFLRLSLGLLMNSTIEAQTVVHVNINQPASLSLSTSLPSTYCLNEVPVQINTTTTGGTPNYTYEWHPGRGLSDSTIANPLASPIPDSTLASYTVTYTVTVHDALNCTKTDTAVMQILICDGFKSHTNDGEMSILPNPSNGQFLMQVNGVNTTSAKLIITNSLVKVLRTFEYNLYGTMLNADIDVSDLNAGIYFMTLTAGTRNFKTKVVVK